MHSFIPPHRILMGPGPSDVSPRILQAMGRPTIGHLDPLFQSLMEEVKGGLQQLFQAPDHTCLPLPAPGTGAMEAAIMNLLEPGEVAVVAVNGQFGERMADMAERAGADVVRVDHAWGEPVDVRKVEAALWARGAKVLAFVHAETSTGVFSDPAPLCALARDHGALSIVDTVTGLGGIEVNAAGWGADVLYSATQKCLSAPPGLAPIAFGPRALEAIAARKTKARTWLFDVGLLMSYWGGVGGRTYHHTAPINAIYGLHEAMTALLEEGVDASIARHKTCHEALAAGVTAAGLDFLVAKANRLPQLNTLCVPEGIDEAKVRARMLASYGVEIGAGLGPLKGRVWRIGLMGASATPWHVRIGLTALVQALAAEGFSVSLKDVLAAVDARLAA
jgi:alanine-glyoxylate transaminase/serine-glyoxylate transaminase/serine-pyruvate transaminase